MVIDMRPRSIKIDESELKRMYFTERRTLTEMATFFGASNPTISARIRELGLRRSASALSEEVVRQLYLVEGKTMAQVADAVGYARTGIRRFIKRCGFLQPRVKRAFNKVEVPIKLTAEELRKLYLDEGRSDIEIGEICGVNNITIANWRRKNGIKRNAGPVHILPLAELTQLYVGEKKTMAEMAAAFGCGESTVRQNIVKYGLGLDSAEVAERRLERNAVRYDRAYIHEGYRAVKIDGHPSANRDGYVKEHRYVAECAMGRYLKPGEQVHHINMQKLDNRPDNLAVIPSKDEHSVIHKHMERVAVFLLGLTDVRPEPVKFGAEVFWGGKYVTEIDMISMAEKSRAG